MNEISLNLKDKTQSLVRRMSLYKWGAGFALVLLVGPLMWMMATALLGLAAAGISAAVLALVIIGIVEYLPVIIAKIQNHKMTLLREEAAKKPIETLYNQHAEKEAVLSTVLQQIEKFATKVKNYELKLVALEQQFPQDVAQFQEVYDAMSTLLKRRIEKYREAKAKNEISYQEIGKFAALWEMALASADLRESAGLLEDTLVQRLQKDSAIGAIQMGVAASMAELQTLMLEEVTIVPVQAPLTLTSGVPAHLHADVVVRDNVPR